MYSKYLYILCGFGCTIGISTLCFCSGLLLGVLLGASIFFIKNKVIKKLLCIYESFFINTPIISQIFFFYFFLNILNNLVYVSVFVLILNSTAHIGLMVREALENIKNVYWDTAYSLGFTPLVAFRKIFLEELFYNNKKIFFGEFVALIKESSLLSFFGVKEVCFRSKEIGMQEYNFVPYILFASVLYFVFISCVNFFFQKSFKEICDKM